MRLIDADSLMKDLHMALQDSDMNHNKVLLTSYACMVLTIAPTIDAVPVVRCKDCLVKQICRYKTGLGDNGFCSQGERKDDNET